MSAPPEPPYRVPEPSGPEDSPLAPAAPERVRWPVEPYLSAGGPLNHAPRHGQRVGRHVVLFVLTVLTTTAVGVERYAAFLSDFGAHVPALTPAVLVGGLWYSATILAILGCHELGHYLACRRYDVDATWPFFLPLPPWPFLTGTLGAFIRIREPIQRKAILFDVGVAGPIAGFVVAVPAVFLGFWLSNVARLPDEFQGMELGEPLLFRAAAWLIFGTPPAGHEINLHPVAFAAWFGLLATALNLIPIGQLDGGHISYAVLGRKSFSVTLVSVLCAVLLTRFSPSWYVWTAIIVLMLIVFGPRHPPVPDEHVPLDPARKAVAVLALVIFVLCFTPAPIEVIDLVPR